MNAPTSANVVQGADELARTIDYIIRVDGPRVARKAINAAITEISKGIRSAVPQAKTAGHSNRSIKAALGRRVSVRNGKVTAKAGFGVGKRKAQANQFARNVIRGTLERKHRTTGRRTGRIKPTNTVERGYNAKSSQAMAAAEQKAAQEVQKIRRRS